ncbi:MAG: hypothetical protein P8129_07090 [Anaerolineae bacterium]
MKKVSIFLVVALLSTLFVLPVSAQTTTWNSGFQVQNLSSTTVASILIYYYNQDGTEAITPVSDSIDPMSSKTYFPIHAAEGFNGSVVVESTEPVVAIANTIGSTATDTNFYWASTESFSAGAQQVSLPLIMRANAGFSTWFNVQNAGASDATVSVEYVPGSAGSAYTEPDVIIAPGASHTFDQAGLAALGTKFVGSAVITSDVPVVATVMQVGAKTMLGYNGFTGAGSTEVALPLVMANNNGFFTGIQVQNVGGTPTDITVSFGANIAGAFAPVDETATLQPGASATFLQNSGQFLTDKYVGSATITSTTEPIVAIVNQLKPGRGTAYDGFDPAAATESVSAPLIQFNPDGGWFTGIQIMNVGGSPVDITVDYGANTAGTFAPPSENATIQPGDSYNSLQNTAAWVAGGKYIGSAFVTASSGGQIVMIVNQLRGNTGKDTFMTYNGFNY